MFKVGQKVLFTTVSAHETGIEGVIVEVDEKDEACPYFVEFTDEDEELVTEWCYPEEVEADGEVTE